jgi:putative cardiolipin synthase
MHNKTYIADNRFAIIGGRNIGDRYFGLYESFVQDDLDVLLAGEVVADVSNSFDEFWNSAHSFPLTAFGAGRDEGGGAAHGEGGVAALESRLEGTIASESRRLASFPLERADWTSFLDGLVTSYAPAESDFFFDSPDVWNPSAARLYPRFKALVASAEHEVLISSPYFIPDADFRELIRSLVARGVRVAIMTNSLATNSHVVAHTGYKRWRRDVLAAGAELYEMREDATAIRYYVTPPATTKEL